jgi:hypothetical protein
MNEMWWLFFAGRYAPFFAGGYVLPGYLAEFWKQ